MGCNLRSWSKRLVPLLAAALFCCFTPSASADSIQYSLSQSNLGQTGPFGTVTVSLDLTKTVATVTFASNTVNGNIYLFGDTSAVAVNVNATSYSVIALTTGWANGGTGFTAPSGITDEGSKNVNGFGTLSDSIKVNDGGFTHAADTYQFTMTNTGGTWTGAGNVLINNASGVALAAHIFVTTSPANASNGATTTGYAANNGGGPGGPPSPLPEPSSMLLMGGLLGGLGVFGYRRHTRRQLAA